ncbi:MAG: DinB family protein [Niabella sp.]
MDQRIEKIKKIRQFLIGQIADLTDAELNKVPVGFRNNIIWNVTHLISAQQAICYLRSGQEAIAAGKFIAPFFTGTQPERYMNLGEVQEVKQLFIDTIDQLQTDYDKKIFNHYTPSPNIFKVYGIEINGIDDALDFLLYHEGYHSGCILALRKLVSL